MTNLCIHNIRAYRYCQYPFEKKRIIFIFCTKRTMLSALSRRGAQKNAAKNWRHQYKHLYIGKYHFIPCPRMAQNRRGTSRREIRRKKLRFPQRGRGLLPGDLEGGTNLKAELHLPDPGTFNQILNVLLGEPEHGKEGTGNIVLQIFVITINVFFCKSL